MINALVTFLYVFSVLLVLNSLVLGILWILFLNFGIFEVPDEHHWSNKLNFYAKPTRPQLPWTLNFFDTGVASSSDVFVLFKPTTAHQTEGQLAFNVTGSDSRTLQQSFSPGSAQSEPQKIYDAAA